MQKGVIKTFAAFTYCGIKSGGYLAHIARRRSGARNVDDTNVMGDVDDTNLTEELLTCKIFLVDTEMYNGRYRIFNFAMHPVDLKVLQEKLDTVVDNLK